MLRFVDAANLLTLGSLLSAFASVLLAMNGRTGMALIALIVSGLCDLFDGLLARRLRRNEQQRRFGGALDSLVDGCAFGLAPSLLLYCTGMRSWLEIAVLGLLPVSVVWRVAYFEVVGLQSVEGDHENARKYYVGLPATYVALALPLVALVGLLDAAWFRWAEAAAVVLVCALMVSTVPIRKPRGLAYAGFAVLAIAVIGVLSAYGSLLPTFVAN